MPSASLIISFYNRIDYLKLIFAGLERQTFTDFEIIIADDGSNPDSVKELEELSLHSKRPVIHLWQEDKGFRKNKILNRAIQSASTEYLIFIDGDCVPHSQFIGEHFNNRQHGVCLTGRRVNLSSEITAKLTYEKVKNGWLEKISNILIDGLFGKTTDAEKGIYTKNTILRNFFNKKKRGLLGCNFSIHKSDILAINGFDERYEAPSIGEDSDIQFRLELMNVRIMSLNNIAVQYHLYHKLQERPQVNLDLFNSIKNERVSYTPYGICRK